MRSMFASVPVGAPAAPLRRVRGVGRVRHLAALLAATLLATGLATVGPHAPATADTKPTEPGNPTTVPPTRCRRCRSTASPGPRSIAGGKVYVAGSFSTARPAGAAPGVSTIPRANLLAYDLATGA